MDSLQDPKKSPDYSQKPRNSSFISHNYGSPDNIRTKPRFERVFPIRIDVAGTKHPISVNTISAREFDVNTTRVNSAPSVSSRQESPFEAAPPLVSTILPFSEPPPGSSSTQRYLTNTFEYVHGPGDTSSLPYSITRKTYRCEDEPIHIPGAVQRYGALVALAETEGMFLVRVVSDNSKSVIGLDSEDLFELRCFTDILTRNVKEEFVFRCRTLMDNPPSRHPDVFQVSLTSLRGAPIPLFCAMHVNQESKLIICEFELEQDVFNPADMAVSSPQEPVQTLDPEAVSEESLLSTTIKSKPLHALRIARNASRPLGSMDMFHVLSECQEQLENCTELSDLLDKIVGLVYELTSFHRVMVYRFEEDAAGYVASEMVNPKASTDLWRGLHYPASDIPKQARQLYLSNKIRVLYDREQETSRLICRTFDDAKIPLNLEHSYLRAMSPIHLRYLANMGVHASMSISLVVNQNLWGLVSCHNYGVGMRISLPLRELCHGFGDIASSKIEKLLYSSRIQLRRPLSSAVPKTSPFGYITSSSADLLNMFRADFGFLVIRDEARTIGKLTAYNECMAILYYIRKRSFPTVFSSHAIDKDCPDFNYPRGLSVLSGMLVVPLTLSGSEFLVFLRKAQEKEIHWAGNPYHKASSSGTSYLEPRSSFKRWTESVMGKSREWTEDEVNIACVLTTLYSRFIEIWRQKEAIVQQNRMTRVLIRNAGNEVRTPLNNIINYLEAALGEHLDEQARYHLRMSLEASRSLVLVVNNLLRLTEAESGEVAAHEDDIELRSFASDVIASFKDGLNKKTIYIRFQDDSSDPQIVRCDPGGLRQVLSNLLAHAAHNSDIGSIIVVILARIETTENNDLVCISVKDEGQGLLEGQLDTIFQDFEKILEDEDPTSLTVEATRMVAPGIGIGLGLATAARFARVSHGQISISSDGLGRGTTVSLIIPLRSSVEAQPSKRRRLAPQLVTSPEDLPLQSETGSIVQGILGFRETEGPLKASEAGSTVSSSTSMSAPSKEGIADQFNSMSSQNQ